MSSSFYSVFKETENWQYFPWKRYHLLIYIFSYESIINICEYLEELLIHYILCKEHSKITLKN